MRVFHAQYGTFFNWANVVQTPPLYLLDGISHGHNSKHVVGDVAYYVALLGNTYGHISFFFLYHKKPSFRFCIREDIMKLNHTSQHERNTIVLYSSSKRRAPLYYEGIAYPQMLFCPHTLSKSPNLIKLSVINNLHICYYLLTLNFILFFSFFFCI